MKHLTTQFLEGETLNEIKKLFAFNRGIERETLRVTTKGDLSQKAAPSSLGNILTNPFITADFAEAQPELITSVHQSPSAVLEELRKIHIFVSENLGEELMWSTSMPCRLPPDPEIAVANFGKTNLGRLKNLYREGLAKRYGKQMQTICAIHYNFSFNNKFWKKLKHIEGSTSPLTKFKSDRYFDLMRNFRRLSWLLTYLYGASPAICSSFVKNKDALHVLKYDDTTFFMPFATSLRSGDLGYQSKVQREHVRISYNGLSEYASSLKNAIQKEHQAYVLLDNLPKNEKSQISSNLLQSEAEFYTSIRAKTNLQTGENFIKSLLNRGVEYVELRLLDLNPFSPTGITEEQIRFLDIFLLFCLVSKSQKDDRKTEDDNSHNHFLTALEGRNRETILSDAGNKRTLYRWANEILDSFKELSDFLDNIEGSTRYSESLKQQQKLIRDPELTPSGKMLLQMQEREISFLDFGISKAKEYRDYYNGTELHPNELKFLQDISNKSHGVAKKLEEEPSNHFDEYLKDFLSGYNN